MKKKKIFNDPIYGFIELPYDLLSSLVEHPYFQRLRRIRQLGITHLVYPGALHTRFHHAMGAMHLMGQAVEVLRSKGCEITGEEAEAVTIAILLHDIGHGPFSHALENSIAEGISHEDISALMMDRLNDEFGGRLTLAIKIFRNEYHKHFLHQLVSSQLDMDRLDYLNRDSFYSGVSEGIISSDRIIKMLDVVNDSLVIEAKGIYSVEKFIVARRLMYWQVYLHKTAVSAEHLLVNILRRAKKLADQGEDLFATPALTEFLRHHYTKKDFVKSPSLLDLFSELDDDDIFTSIKVWIRHRDRVLSLLCERMARRKLLKIEIRNRPFEKETTDYFTGNACSLLGIGKEDVSYFVFTGKLENNAYNSASDKINILYKDGAVLDIAQASDTLNISVLSRPVVKHFLCYPKELEKIVR